MDNQLISKVWHIPSLIGSVVPGILVYEQGAILFITEDGIQFNEPLSALTGIKWPFLRMGFGFDVAVNGKKYKFSFAKPNPSAPEIDVTDHKPYPEVIAGHQYFNDISSLLDIKNDKATTKKWKEILGKK
ncbi:MAG: hypothetical protein SGI83_08070 [Bacteroidota bacterium]|nr:hypothetical protein [Bacteroidota bacterium]